MPLPRRLIAALKAGEKVGGDKRGKQSAALKIYSNQEYSELDLRVDDHVEPLLELARLEAVSREVLDGVPCVPGDARESFRQTRSRPDQRWPRGQPGGRAAMKLLSRRRCWNSIASLSPSPPTTAPCMPSTASILALRARRDARHRRRVGLRQDGDGARHHAPAADRRPGRIAAARSASRAAIC